MDIKRFTYVAGIVFVVVGILGFIPGVTTAPHVNDPNLAIETAYGRLFGLFPVNAVHNLVHIALGLWALAVANDFAKSRIYCKATAIIYAVLMVMGFIPNLNTMFGLAPLHSHDVWLHALFAIATAYYGYVDVSDREGFTAPRRATSTNTSLRWS